MSEFLSLASVVVCLREVPRCGCSSALFCVQERNEPLMVADDACFDLDHFLVPSQYKARLPPPPLHTSSMCTCIRLRNDILGRGIGIGYAALFAAYSYPAWSDSGPHGAARS